MRAVTFDRYGPPEVLAIVEVEEPIPGPGEVLITVDAAALNAIDSKVRRGARPVANLPAGTGRELSGIVAAVGDGVDDIDVGELVIATGEGALRERYLATRGLVMPVPAGLDPVVAACLPVAPQTAWCAVESQEIGIEDTVLVSAAAGGVGFIAAQLAIAKGARVLGTAGPRNDALLRSIGVTPVRYGPDLAERLRAAAPDGITVVLDHHGPETIEAALALGVPRERINSTSGLAERYVVPAVGRVGLDPAIIQALAERIVSGALQLPIERVYPLDEVVNAFRHLDTGHLSGKIVIDVAGRNGERP